MSGERLDRDGSVELEIAREVDDPHPTSANLALDLVLSDERFGESGNLRHAGLIVRE
jgi:hypothetical protein